MAVPLIVLMGLLSAQIQSKPSACCQGHHGDTQEQEGLRAHATGVVQLVACDVFHRQFCGVLVNICRTGNCEDLVVQMVACGMAV